MAQVANTPPSLDLVAPEAIESHFAPLGERDLALGDRAR